MSDLEQNSFYKYLISNGYYFDKQLIENYLLSLKVKPFEILTGNSGTGKTKLSQLLILFSRRDLSVSLIRLLLPLLLTPVKTIILFLGIFKETFLRL